MKAIDLCFCKACCQRILSRELSDFWKLTCLNSIRRADWMPFEDTPENNLYLKTLEKKGFLITMDHENKIVAKPLGIMATQWNDTYIVCLCPEEHFQKR